jgi:rhodanese-related sulfurtransferase
MSLLKRILATVLLLLTGLGARAAGMDTISPDDALAQATAGKLILVDVRTPGEWAQTGIPAGAATVEVTAGRDAFLAGVLRVAGGDRNRPLAIICRSGGRSTSAQAMLLSDGFTRVLNVKEGVLGGSNGPGWKARGLPMQAWQP